MKIRLVVYICFLALGQVFCQDAALNNSKYWFYRYRLVHEFLAKGQPSGFSIPASTGNFGDKIKNNNHENI